MKTMMTRHVKTKVRYYTIEVFPTLFGETLVVRSYGGCGNAKPTGTIMEYYDNTEEAQNRVHILAHRKCKGGYAVATTLLKKENKCLC